MTPVLHVTKRDAVLGIVLSKENKGSSKMVEVKAFPESENYTEGIHAESLEN